MELQDLYEHFSDRYKTDSEGRTGAGSNALVTYDHELYFVIDPVKYWGSNESGEAQLTFGCAGGTVEKKEGFVEALHREIREEMSCQININSSSSSFYIDVDGNCNTVRLNDKIKPLFIYEHAFSNPDLGASLYLIVVYQTVALSQPRPAAEIPALFSSDLTGLKQIYPSMRLEKFYQNYTIYYQKNLPKTGIITPYQSPIVLLEHLKVLQPHINQ